MALKVSSSEIGSIDLLKGILMNAGIAVNQIIECEQWPHTFITVYYNSRAKAHDLQRKLRAFHLRRVTVMLGLLRRKDWQTKWKKEFKPFSLTKTFGVIPMRFKNKHRLRGKTPIYLDTDLAFGTGLHTTTRFMAGFVERCRGRFTSFLDLGTGTGILAMIAAKCGAKNITAIDISKDAVRVAKQNCTENNCLAIDIKVADAHKYRSKKQYDFVCANILTQDLIQMAGKVIRLVKPGKYLAVSGISLNSYDMFRQAYAQYPLRCVKIEKGEGWVALLYKKKIWKKESLTMS